MSARPWEPAELAGLAGHVLDGARIPDDARVVVVVSDAYDHTAFAASCDESGAMAMLTTALTKVLAKRQAARTGR